MNASGEDVRRASALVRLALQPKVRPAGDPEYQGLIERYRHDPDFAQLARAIAEGLLLDLVAVEETGAVALPSWPEDAQGGDAPAVRSPFEAPLSEYSARSAGDPAERVLHAVIHLGIAYRAFPREELLEDPGHVSRFTEVQAEQTIRDLCERLDEAVQQNVDPPHDEPDLQRTWRAYLARPEVATTTDGRRHPAATRSQVHKALEWLVAQGLLEIRHGAGEQVIYRTRPAYRHHVRDLASRPVWFEARAQLEGLELETEVL